MTGQEADAALAAARETVDQELIDLEAPKSAHRYAWMGIVALAQEVGLPEESVNRFLIGSVSDSLFSEQSDYSRLGALLDSAERGVDQNLSRQASKGGDASFEQAGARQQVAEALAAAIDESGRWLHFIQDTHRNLEALQCETDPRTVLEGLRSLRSEIESWLKFVTK